MAYQLRMLTALAEDLGFQFLAPPPWDAQLPTTPVVVSESRVSCAFWPFRHLHTWCIHKLM